MPLTKVGIVFATGSHLIRRIIVPDDDSELPDGSHVGDGETIITAPIAGGWDTSTCQAAIMAATGDVSVPTGRCALIDPTLMLVTDLVQPADPYFNSAAFAPIILIPSDVAQIGWVYDGASLSAPPA